MAGSCVLGRASAAGSVYKHLLRQLLQRKHVVEEAMIVKQAAGVPQEKWVCLIRSFSKEGSGEDDNRKELGP